jgi:hypothetical protein
VEVERSLAEYVPVPSLRMAATALHLLKELILFLSCTVCWFVVLSFFLFFALYWWCGFVIF